MKTKTFDDIKPRSLVTFLIPNGIGRNGVEYKEKSGRAVMKGPHGWVINGGGRHGTPHVVSEENFVKTT
jgi:hypothetical protein|tara:strand:+ start:677 stop:883 length:207 start_codon:yes stop_codon:yes gene_type:complete